MYDKDTFLLQRGYNRQQQRAFADGWKARHERRVRRAWEPGGYIDHTPDKSAPFGTLARYGYLLPLEGEEVLASYNEFKQRHDLQGAPGDNQRWAWEDKYIKAHRKAR